MEYDERLLERVEEFKKAQIGGSVELPIISNYIN